MYLNDAARDIMEEIRVVVQDREGGAAEERIKPWLQLLGLRVFVISVQRNDVVAQNPPKSPGDGTTNSCFVPEPPDAGEAICKSPYTRAEIA